MNRIAIIGSGNVASSLAGRISELPGLTLAGIAARNPQSGRALAGRMDVPYSWPEVPEADLYIIAVRDDAIEDICRTLNLPPDAVVAHTSGSVAMAQIGHPNAGVIYPLQSFAAEAVVDWRAVPVFTEWSTPRARQVVESVASQLSENVRPLSSGQRARLHVAGVLASNFPNLMYAAAERVMADAGLDFRLLLPIIERSTARLAAGESPADMQSGPALRGDVGTQGRHLELLREAYPEYEKMYETLSRLIWETLRKM